MSDDEGVTHTRDVVVDEHWRPGSTIPERDPGEVRETVSVHGSALAGLSIAPTDQRPTALVFDGMFTIRPGGHVELQPGVDLDDAARAFWSAVERLAPAGLRGDPPPDTMRR